MLPSEGLYATYHLSLGTRNNHWPFVGSSSPCCVSGWNAVIAMSHTKGVARFVATGIPRCFGFRNKKRPRICLKKTFQSCFGDIIKKPIAFMGLVDLPSSMSFKHFSLGKSWMINAKNVSYYLCFSMVLIEIAVGILRESTWENIHRKNRQGPPPFLPQNGIRGKPTLPPCLFLGPYFFQGLEGGWHCGGRGYP